MKKKEKKAMQEEFIKCKAAAEAGDSAEMYRLGIMYGSGEGVKRNATESFYWCKEAAEAGNTEAMISVSYMYEDGEGIAKDNQESLRWLMKAVKAGDARAMYILSLNYALAGEEQEAYRWRKSAADAGDADAMCRMGESAKEFQESKSWYLKAVENGSTDAMKGLARLYASTGDRKEQVRWYIREKQIKLNSTNKKKKRKVQPAKESYFFSRCLEDIRLTDQVYKEMNEYNALGLGGLVIKITSFCIMWSTFIYKRILAYSFAMLAYAAFAIIWAIDKVYTIHNKIATACPYDDCQCKFALPVYECSNPNCQEKHDYLAPGRYGILKRTCNCGQKLPTTFINGRGKLKAYCPQCGRPLSGGTASRQYAIPVIGGPSVGKTCYIHMTINNLMTTVAKQQRWELNFLDEANRNEYEAVVSAMKNGIKPQKTDFDALNAYQLSLKLPSDSIPRRIYFYDIAGEQFLNGDTILKQNAFSYADGCIFMIDPLTVAAFAQEVAGDMDIDGYGISKEDFGDIFNTMLINMEKLFRSRASDKLRLKLAVVLNKCDIPRLDKMVGRATVNQYMKECEGAKTYQQAKSDLCRDFLVRYGCNGFVSLVEKNFKNVQYFGCSSLEHNEIGKEYVGVDCEQPFLWLLKEIDRDIGIKL